MECRHLRCNDEIAQQSARHRVSSHRHHPNPERAETAAPVPTPIDEFVCITKNTLAIGFGVLLLLSMILWVVGLFAGATIPLFGGIRAESLGATGFVIAMVGEGCTYLFGWLHRGMSQRSTRFTGFWKPQLYGNKDIEPIDSPDEKQARQF